MRFSTLVGVLMVAACLCGNAQADTIIFDHGPASGTPAASYRNSTGVQTFVDDFTLAHDEVLTGYHLFGSDFDPGGNTLHFELFSDSGGLPGTKLDAFNLSPANVTDTQQTAGAYEIIDYTLDFSATPIPLTAGLTYWVGVSGNGFNPGQIALYPGPDDSQIFVNPDNAGLLAKAGDQVFQLVGHDATPAPLPSVAVSFLALFAGFGGWQLYRSRGQAGLPLGHSRGSII